MAKVLLKTGKVVSLACVAATCLGALAVVQNTEWKSGIAWKEPAKVDTGAMAEPAPVPSDAIVLFDGSDLDAWVQGNGQEPAWVIDGDAMSSNGGGIRTRESFGDIQLHVEFMTPEGQDDLRGQGKGNSGIYLMGMYEVQILESHSNTTYFDGQAGAIYKQSPPLVNASRPPGQWQSYDIIFEHPHFDEAGEVVEPAYFTVLHNGVVVQNRFAVQGATSWSSAPAYTSTAEAGPIFIQDKGHPIKFRNIWVRELKLADEDRID